MPEFRSYALLALVALAMPAFAAPPNACEVVTPEEINNMAERKVESVRLQKAGNPSECAFLDSRKGAVLVVWLKEVQYAVKDEFGVERGNLEKIYRAKAKELDTVGDGGFWMGANKSLWFRKGKTIASITFQSPKNQNEVDSGQIARLIESRLGK